jgi:hypothetical protein
VVATPSAEVQHDRKLIEKIENSQFWISDPCLALGFTCTRGTAGPSRFCEVRSTSVFFYSAPLHCVVVPAARCARPPFTAYVLARAILYHSFSGTCLY